MLQRNALLPFVLTLILVGTLSAQEPLLTPQAGILLLRNGQILQGEITRAGDYYVVTLGATGEIKLPATDVEAQVESMSAAYAYKQSTMLGTGEGPHLDLAEWCLRHGLKAQCAEQLVLALRIQPESPRLAAIERRLQFAVETTKPVAPTVAATNSALSNDQIEAALRDVSPAALERFAAVVQPLMLNRCAANQCHGPNAKSELSLLRPANGQSANQRFTQRNLYSVLQQIDRKEPDNSPLLTMPQRRHGTSLTPVFDEHTKRQLDELTVWVRIVTGYEEPVAPRAAQPATVPTQPGSALHQNGAPVGEGAPSTPVDASADSPSPTSPTPDSSPESRFTPRDEFDPEIFNRHYFPR